MSPKFANTLDKQIQLKFIHLFHRRSMEIDMISSLYIHFMPLAVNLTSQSDNEVFHVLPVVLLCTLPSYNSRVTISVRRDLSLK